MDLTKVKEYGLYFEFMNPQTAYVVVEALSELEARKIFETKIAPSHKGTRLLSVNEVKEKLTYPPTRPSSLALPAAANRS